jgi:Holliday junction resolvasome RuvABC endonuclease subunit
MRILGIDCGTERTGYGLIESDGRSHRMIAAGSIHTSLEIKSSVVGYGRAEKQQVRLMVHSLLHIADEIESEDACDAIAVAICHATRLASDSRLRGAV